MKTLEQMAEEAGITVGAEPKGGALGMYVPRHYLEAFAALVAERCAALVQHHIDHENTGYDGPEHHLAMVKSAITAEFPKP